MSVLRAYKYGDEKRHFQVFSDARALLELPFVDLPLKIKNLKMPRELNRGIFLY